MKQHLFALLTTLIFFACSNNKAKKHFTTRDYITVGKMMDSIHPPYIIDVSNGNKRVVFIGCDHNNDSLDAQFKIIEQYAMELKPTITFNEGGQIEDSTHYHTLGEAASKDGETGALKFCADKLGMPIQNGDISFKTEWPITTKKQSKEDFYLYYTIERFAVPYKYGAYGKIPFDSVFIKHTIPYFLKNEFPLTKAEQSFSYFKQLYKQSFKQVFNIDNIDIEAFDYVNPNCHFCEVGRTSKMVRDSILLTKIKTALQTNDRVMVTFGHGHALALEPALHELLK